MISRDRLLLLLVVLVDLFLVWVVSTLSEPLDAFDQAWVLLCVTGHMGLYAGLAMPSLRPYLYEHVADNALAVAIPTSCLLANKSLLTLAIITKLSVGTLALLNDLRCILTGDTWPLYVQISYFPLLALQLHALGRRQSPA